VNEPHASRNGGKHGGNEDQAIGALLRDAAEDQGGAETLEEIRRRFGDAVAEIVSDCTDAWTEPKPDWRPRKEAYLAKLPSKPARSLLVSLADKTHNAEAISLTIVSWATRSGSGSTAARRAHAGITVLWPTCSPKPCPDDCRTGSRGL
jgi:HD domain-containing protein